MESTRRKTKVLFICIGNMCRSPMAEGFARELGGELITPYSAGITPTGLIAEDAIAMMKEKGIDISEQRSNGFGAIPLEDIDIAVNMSGYPAAEFMPAVYDGEVIDWLVEDPIGKPTEVFRRVRDEIETRVRGLIETVWRNS